MSRESPSGWSVWDGNRETEAIPAVTTLDPEERGVQVGQSDYEEYQPVTECVPAETPLVVPVTGESFCQCPTQTDLSSQTQLDTYALECTCGEDESGCVWVWHEECKSPAVLLSCSNRKVSFHPDYSCGTAAVRGSAELRHGQHFWEIKMTSPVYGTDMMVGIGTPEVNLDQFRHSFCSMLGADAHSWGLSYTGLLHHKGSKVSFSPRFGQGSIIGLHLDTWHGTLTFYKNRRWIGVAATGLRNKSFYPMVCSTAAKSSMKVISSVAAPTSLQYLCCIHLRDYLPDVPDALSALPLPPGLKLQLSQQLGWVLRLRRPEASTHTCAEDSQPGHAPCQSPYLDSTSLKPAHTYLISHPDSAHTPGHTHPSSHPDSASFTPADTYLSPHPDSASFTPADTHLSSHPDPASFLDATATPDSAHCTPADICLTFRPDSASYFDDDNAAYPDSAYCTPAHTYLSSHPDSASCKYVDPDLFSDLGSCSDSASCSDPASCPCCDAPLSLATCGHDDCLSSASCCSGPAFRPTSPLPDQSCCPSSPDPAQSRPGATSGSDSDSCTSETCQRKRCRWT
ncbi:SPRY domain-containing SOCS box protein 3 isoform X1 [Pygocentrus nattereri]|uniref:SPRY domain-containing SOCS box protein 3 isoform X1 n=1 Tax=Pygocentrus nattereri TaxID=42514 RepID=UPI0018918998|nr:SPRY domain-containing SOCS box protein 3 isoform X1 [Pygocentrus nattereri]